MTSLTYRFRLFLLLLMGALGLSHSLHSVTSVQSVTPGNGTLFENQVGQAISITVVIASTVIDGSDDGVFAITWSNSDSTVFNEEILNTSSLTFPTAAAGTQSMTASFTPPYTGTFNFNVRSPSGVIGTFSYNVPSVGSVPSGVNITFPADGASFLPGEQITITAQASDPDGSISKVEFLLGDATSGLTGNPIFTVLAEDTTAPYSTTFTIGGVGEYKISARAFDSAGNSTRSSTVSFFGSETPVLQTLTSVVMRTPLDGSSVSVINPVELSAVVQPAALRTQVSLDYFVDGFKVNDTPITESSTEGFFEFSYEGYVGTYPITARASLNNGTFVETLNAADVTFVAVGSDPQMSISAPLGAGVTIGTTRQFTVQAADSGALIEEVELIVNGESVATETRSSFPFVFDFTFPSMGFFDIYAIGTFTNGNRARTNVISITVGAGAAPSVSVVAPLSGGQFLPGTNLPILVTANDPNSLIEQVQIFVNNTLIQTALRQTGGSFSPELNTFSYVFPFPGDYSIYAQAQDASGNVSQSNVVNVKAANNDNTTPKVVMSHPLPVGGGDTVNDVSVGSSMFLNALATDGDGTIQQVRFYINGQQIGTTSTKFRDTYSLFFEPTTPGTYYIFAEAVDNDGKIGQSSPLQLSVNALEASLPIIQIQPLNANNSFIDQGSSVNISALADGGLIGIDQVNFYVNGVFLDADDAADDGNDLLFTSDFLVDEAGTFLVYGRAIQIDPNGLTTDNWVISDPVGLVVSPRSSNRDFVIRTQQDFFGVTLSQSDLDQQVSRLDSGQVSQAQYIFELTQQASYLNTREGLMARFLLSGDWPNPSVQFQDLNTMNTLGLGNLVTVLLPVFQNTYFAGKRIPDAFSSDADYEEFFRLLFNNKYGSDPQGDQTSRGVQQMKALGTNNFVIEFIRDTDALPFGGGTISAILGIPNPPNTRLPDLADSASILINMLNIDPSTQEVENLSNQPLLNQIQSLLQDSRY